MAERIEGLGLGLGLKALIGKGGGVDPLALLGAVGLVHRGCFYGLLNRPTAVAALGVAGAVPAILPLLPDVVLLVDVVILALAIGVAVREHLAVGPNELAVDGDVGVTGVVALLAAKAKELRAGGVVTVRSGGAVGDVEDVLVRLHVRVVDVHRLLVEPARGRVERAVLHVDDNIVLACAVIGVDVDNLAAGVEGAAIKRHGWRAVRPDGVVALRGIERRIVELGGLVAPVERLAVNDAVVKHGLVGANEAKVVGTAGTHRHVLEGDGAGAVEGVIAVVLGAKIIGVGNLCTDVPCGLVRAQAHKGKVLALGEALGALPVEGVVALTEHKGVATLRLFGGDGDVGVGCLGAIVSDARLGSQRRGGAHEQGANHAENGRCYDPPRLNRVPHLRSI